MALQTKYAGDNSGRGPSQGIWSDCPWLEIVADPSKGTTYWDDFMSFGGRLAITDDAEAVTANIHSYPSDGGSWTVGQIDGLALVPPTTAPANAEYGWFPGALAATDNIAFVAKLGGLLATQMQITKVTGKKFWFEAAVQFSQIAAAQNFFIGFAEENLPAATALGIFSNAGVLSDKDMLGFAIRADGTSTVEAVHNTAGGGGTVDNGDIATIVAATPVKLGIKYERSGRDGERLGFYRGGVEILAVGASVIGAATFPSAQRMAMYIAGTNGSAAVKNMHVDWARFCQLSS